MTNDQGHLLCWGSEFSRYEIELPNWVTQTDVVTFELLIQLF